MQTKLISPEMTFVRHNKNRYFLHSAGKDFFGRFVILFEWGLARTFETLYE